MANIELKDRGSRKHVLNLLESDFRSQINALIARSGCQLSIEKISSIEVVEKLKSAVKWLIEQVNVARDMTVVFDDCEEDK